jgi:hypothetical protein
LRWKQPAGGVNIESNGLDMLMCEDSDYEVSATAVWGHILFMLARLIMRAGPAAMLRPRERDKVTCLVIQNRSTACHP